MSSGMIRGMDSSAIFHNCHCFLPRGGGFGCTGGICQADEAFDGSGAVITPASKHYILIVEIK